jgi:hypothetical protein
MITLEDRFAIYDLLAQYNRTIDLGLAEEWANTFTEDGVFNSFSGPKVGRDELTAFLAEAEQRRLSGERARTQHWVGNIVVEGGPDEVKLWCQHLNVTVDPAGDGDAGRIAVVAYYEDVLRKENGEWRFAVRTPKRWPYSDQVQ